MAVRETDRRKSSYLGLPGVPIAEAAYGILAFLIRGADVYSFGSFFYFYQPVISFPLRLCPPG
jgi:hypothetical protein